MDRSINIEVRATIKFANGDRETRIYNGTEDNFNKKWLPAVKAEPNVIGWSRQSTVRFSY